MILSKLTVTPLLYLCGVLLAGLIGTVVYASVLSARADAAVATAGTRAAERDKAITERDAWKQRAAEVATAVNAHRRALVTMQGELERAQGETRRIDAAARQSIAAAQAAATDADRTLTRMAAQFQAQARQPDCAQALAAMAAACPAMGGY